MMDKIYLLHRVSIQLSPRPVRPPIRSARPSGPPAEDRIPPGITVPYSVLHSAQGFHSTQPAPGPPARRPPAEDWIPPGITVPYSVLHFVYIYIYMSKPPHYSCFSTVWGVWPEVNRKRCFWKTLLLHYTFYNISKNYYIISDISIVKKCFPVISVVKRSQKIIISPDTKSLSMLV